SPADLRKLKPEDLPALAAELRETIIDVVSRNGGHLASSLGAVELELALHYVFNTPQDKLLFDVGHQIYAHKLLTGRREMFQTLRKFGGCSGFCCPAESEYDSSVSGHAGVAISTAVGMAKALGCSGSDAHVVAVVGDGSLNCGVSLEGLNNARGCRNLIVILNDNQMSISRNVGGLSHYLNRMISARSYNRFKAAVKHSLTSLPRYETIYRLIRRMEDAIKAAVLPPGSFFESLGFRYIGPIDGHSLPELLHTFDAARSMNGPVFLHVLTEKGHGCEYASREPSRYHGVPGFDRATGELPAPGGDSFSAAFGRAATGLAALHPEVAAITAGMTAGTGLTNFAKRFGDRFFDVGIAEEHAVAFAAGLANGGMRPVCALYATFMQRALDCVYHDVVLPGLPVIFALDRAGAVADGPTHHGIYDLSFLREMPRLTIMAPADEFELERMFELAYELASPVAIRYPRGGYRGAELPRPELKYGRAAVLKPGSDVMIWCMGPEVADGLAASEILKAHGVSCGVVNARFIRPFDAGLWVEHASAMMTVTLEDHCVTGGLAAEALAALGGMKGTGQKFLCFGWPADEIIPHGSVSELKAKYALTPEAIAQKIEDNLHQ
ncbi:MAG: 1-deoxy-D-xylulose-5-phosphate synthase, partial [Victivallaceae bacterium]|nr:1-deoxy-D-xylulose-5-phosphate synthase [Victivallaceae bacterium]